MTDARSVPPLDAGAETPGAAALPAAFARLADIGHSPGDGVMRLTASATDGAARRALAAWMEGAGARMAHDGIGNQFACFDWAGAGAPWVLAGSHLDAQPNGGRFDGVLGVVAAGCAALTLAAERAAGRLAPRANLAVVNWTNEEGARFQPSLIGSTVFAGALPLAAGLACRDRNGVSLGEALRAIGYGSPAGAVPPHPRAYVELHVEQGRRLEATAGSIGAVEGTWAARKMQVSWEGRAAHTGPTPMAERRDALLAAARAIAGFEDAVARSWPELHRSAARLEVEPNSPNVVVRRATVWFELRHPDRARLIAAGDAVREVFEQAASATGTRLEIASDATRAAASMDAGLVARVEATARACGLLPLRMASVAGHDAVALQNAGIPSALVLVASTGGIAHHPDEFTAPADMQAGLAVLTALLRGLITDAAGPGRA